MQCIDGWKRLQTKANNYEDNEMEHLTEKEVETSLFAASSSSSASSSSVRGAAAPGFSKLAPMRCGARCRNPGMIGGCLQCVVERQRREERDERTTVPPAVSSAASQLFAAASSSPASSVPAALGAATGAPHQLDGREKSSPQ